MKQDKWTKQLRNQLANHEVAAPDDLWDGIEAALVQQPKPRPSRFVLWRRWSAAAAVAAVLLGGGFWLWHDGSRSVTTKPASADVSLASTAEPSSVVSESAPERPSTTAPVPSNQAVAKKKKQRPLIAQTDVSEEQEEVSGVQPVVKQTSSASDKENTQGAQSSHVVKPDRKTAMQTQRHQVEERLAKIRKKGPSIGLYAMNGMGGQTHLSPVRMDAAMVKQFAGVYEKSNMSKAQLDEPVYLQGYEDRQYHHRPLCYGLTLGYPLTDWLSFSVGLVYTKLTSDFTSVMRAQRVEQQQVLHYVGVSYAFNYRLWNYKNLRTYVSTGVQADFNVSTHFETEGVSQHLDNDRTQWSLRGSLGVQYNLLPQIGIYVEPGLSYYPDNGSHIQNYFKDKPLDVSLQFGIRLNVTR